MSDDEIFSVAKEISDRFVAEWDRLKGDRVPWHMSEVQERVFFEIFLHVVNARHMTTNDVVEVIKVYLGAFLAIDLLMQGWSLLFLGLALKRTS